MFYELLSFLSEAASFCESGLSSSGLAQDGGALGAVHNGRGVAIHYSDLEASGASDVQEVAVGALY